MRRKVIAQCGNKYLIRFYRDDEEFHSEPDETTMCQIIIPTEKRKSPEITLLSVLAHNPYWLDDLVIDGAVDEDTLNRWIIECS